MDETKNKIWDYEVVDSSGTLSAVGILEDYSWIVGGQVFCAKHGGGSMTFYALSDGDVVSLVLRKS